MAVGAGRMDQIRARCDPTGTPVLESAGADYVHARHPAIRLAPSIVKRPVAGFALIRGNPRIAGRVVGCLGQGNGSRIGWRRFSRLRAIRRVADDRPIDRRADGQRLVRVVDPSRQGKHRSRQRQGFGAAGRVGRPESRRGIEIKRVEIRPSPPPQGTSSPDNQGRERIDRRRSIRCSQHNRLATGADPEVRMELRAVVRKVPGRSRPDDEKTAGLDGYLGELIFQRVARAVRKVIARHVERRRRRIVDLHPVGIQRWIIHQPLPAGVRKIRIRRLNLVDDRCSPHHDMHRP